MVTAAKAANKCLADITTLSEQGMSLSVYLKMWLSHDNYRNLDLLGGDYVVFLQMVILLLDNPKIHEMHMRDDLEWWLAFVGVDVFNQITWRAFRGSR